jgi:hypothetical protein
VLIYVQIALLAVGGLGERIRSNTLYTYCAVTEEETPRNHVFTILQPISEAVSHNTNDIKPGTAKNCKDDGHEHRPSTSQTGESRPSGLGKTMVIEGHICSFA